MKKLLSIILGICLVGGLIACGSDESSSSSIETDKNINQVVQNENNSTSEENNDVTADVEEDSQNSEANRDYAAMSENAFEQIKTFFEALKDGDIKTVVAMSDTEQETYKALVEISQYDFTKEFLQLFFSNIKYYINEENISDLAEELEDAYEDGDERIHLDLAYSKPTFYMTGNCYLMAFENGTTLPMTEIGTNEEAFQCIEKMMSTMPMTLGSDFWITTPDENGDIKICVDYIFEEMGLHNLRALDAYYPVYYVDNKILPGYDVYIGDNGKPYQEGYEKIEKFGNYLKNKDMDGYAAYLYEITGKDYKSEYENTYGRYEDLSEKQKTFVDNFMANEFQCDFFTYSTSTYKNSILLLTLPVLDDLEFRNISLTGNYIADNIVEVSFEYGFLDNYSEFLWRYYRVIEYAKNNL